MRYLLMALLLLSGCATTPDISRQESANEIDAAATVHQGDGIIEVVNKQIEMRKYWGMTLFERCKDNKAWKRYGSMKQCLQEKELEEKYHQAKIIQSRREYQQLVIYREQEQREAELMRLQANQNFYNGMQRAGDTISNALAGTGTNYQAAPVQLAVPFKIPTKCITKRTLFGAIETVCSEGY